MPALDVYITESCWSCAEAERIVAEMVDQFPGVQIETRDISDDRRPTEVFAVPTYVLDGRIVFLGNPSREALKEKLNAALARAAA